MFMSYKREIYYVIKSIVVFLRENASGGLTFAEAARSGQVARAAAEAIDVAVNARIWGDRVAARRERREAHTGRGAHCSRRGHCRRDRRRRGLRLLFDVEFVVEALPAAKWARRGVGSHASDRRVAQICWSADADAITI